LCNNELGIDVYSTADIAVLMVDDGPHTVEGVASSYGLERGVMTACITWYSALNDYGLAHEIGQNIKSRGKGGPLSHEIGQHKMSRGVAGGPKGGRCT
jgi:hypothetical protein